MPKITGLPPDSTPAAPDYIPLVNTTSTTTSRMTVQQLSSIVGQLMFPVGSIRVETTGTNPATSLGFGTWVQYAQGQVLVGQSTGDANFGTVGNTGGEVTHALSWNEMAVHNHGVNDPGHSHSTQNNYFMDAGGAGNLGLNTPGNRFAQGLSNVQVNGSGTGISTQNAGAGAAHNNLQPYIVVYIWKRVA